MLRPQMATRNVAVVLAGGGDDPLARQAGVATKGEVPFADRTLARWVVDALAEAWSIDAIVSVGGPRRVFEGVETGVRELRRVPAGERLVDSCALGLGAALALAPERVMLLTADLPYLTGGAIDRFVREAPEADLVYPIVERERMEAAFPGQPRTYATLRDGAFTGGNAVLVRPRVVPGLLPLLHDAYRARKNPLRLASLVGWDVLLRLVARRLTIASAEARIGDLLGGEARVWRDADPALAADVDRPEHLSFPPPSAGALAGDTA